MTWENPPRTVAWRTASGDFGQVHFVPYPASVHMLVMDGLLCDGEPLTTLCGKHPEGRLDWNPPLSAETICKTCHERYHKPLKLEK